MYIQKTKHDNFIILQLNRPKVNALNHDLVMELRQAFQDAGSDDDVRGVILTGTTGIFSAGLDLIELYDYDKEKMVDFITAFGLMHIELVEFKKPFICALNGHSPAGGTVIALAADYRIMVHGEQYGIGLNEVAVDVQISDNLIKAYSFWLGKRCAYANILAGKLFTPQRAKDAGLVDELVKDEDSLRESAIKKMKEYLSNNYDILLRTKAKLRKEWMSELRDNRQEELDETLTVWWSTEVRAKMKMFKASLDARKK